MPKGSSYLTRFLLLSALCFLGMTVLFYGLSSYFFDDVSLAGHYESLNESIRLAGKILSEYTEGKVSREELEAAVNPRINPEENFFMLLDREFIPLARTDAAAPYFAGLQSDAAVTDALRLNGSVIVHSQESGAFSLIVGQKTQDGYVIAGCPMRVYSGTVFSFRIRMIVSLAVALFLVLMLSTLATRRVSRPARLITETAGKLIEGEQVQIPEDMPGQEIQEVAKAFNYLSREISRAIADLRYERQTLSLVLEGLSEGVLAVDEKGDLIHENAAALNLLGENTPESRAVMEALRLENGEEQWDGKLQKGEATLYYIINRMSQEESGSFRGTVALIRDITQQERLERTRYDYVANISHELRTPLASMRGLAEGLRDGMVTEEEDRQRYYNLIVSEVTRLSRLVNDLLELSSLQSNPAAFETEKVDPNELIYDLHDRNGSLFAQKEISFLRFLPDAPLPQILSNEDRLSQVLTIFLDNARKYTPSGGEVTLGAEAAADGVRFFVRDNGIGMDEETKRLAFERFHQAERGRSDKGSGLGLSIAREILQKMDVAIDLESSPGEGSEFSFVIGTKEKSPSAAGD